MNMQKMSCLLVVGMVVNFAVAFNAAANPVTVSYVDDANQCANPAPANVALTEEIGPIGWFDADERISIPTVTPALIADCTIASTWDGKINDGCPQAGAASETGAQCDNNTDDDGDLKVNDGCPAVGAAESGTQCDNNLDDDSNDYLVTATNTTGSCWEDVFVVAEPGVFVNDGCPAVGAAESGAQCLNDTDDDPVYDGLVNDGCLTSGPPEIDQCSNNTDDDLDSKVNDGCPAVGAAESGSQCLNATDDDLDGKVNDGCTAVGPAESNQCDNNTDDDGDDKVNDGCPAVGTAESGAQCDNNTDDDPVYDGLVNDGCPQAGNAAETGDQCTNALDDDLANDLGATMFDNWDGTIGGKRAKKLVAKAWGAGDVLSFQLMNVAPNISPLFFFVGVGSVNPTSNFSIVANRGRVAVGACCNAAGPQCLQVTECECKNLGKDFTYRGDGTPCGLDGTCIPTVSEWGVVVMAMLVLTAGTIVVMRRRAMVHGGS